ncbi:hypothetical protein PVAP13_6NG288712 [Panicum virgatum]|uniref:DUF8039 domain-containing protein n=1 Tax=Panicum virgatum TaxID=38727 RepID=A0A8T0QVD2_PANVG|nr:hypothetical protein PVAP13_6NG288712 [Panicum virgatum]
MQSSSSKSSTGDSEPVNNATDTQGTNLNSAAASQAYSSQAVGSSTRARKSRTQTKWLEDKVTATGLDEQGWPTPDAARERFVLVEDLTLETRRDLFTILEEKIEYSANLSTTARNKAIKSAMKEIALLQRRFKTHLRADFVRQDELPFEKHPFLKPEDWEQFVETTRSPLFKHVSQEMKEKRAKHNKPHKMGKKLEDEKLAAEGKENPWEQYLGRSRPYLRARSGSTTSASGDITLTSPLVVDVADKVKRIAAQDSDGSFTGVRENDVLTEALENPEHRGRVRGVSSSLGWGKGFGPECAEMYRKKKKRRSDVDKKEIVGEAINRVMELLRVAGVPIPDGLCLTQSVQNRSSDNTTEEDVPINKGQNDGPPQPDTIDLLTEPTKCSLLDGSECDMELALGTVYPNQQTCHTVPVQNGYAVVQPTYVWPNARHIKLPIPVEDEITTLADSLLQCIQRPRRRILIPPRSRDPNSAAPSAAKAASAGPHSEHEPKNMEVGAVWTMANPKYKPGEPMLSEKALKSAGPSCQALHAYIIKQSGNGAIDILAKVAASYFHTEDDLKLAVGFNDLYDLYNLDSLDMSLLRCWTL